MKKINGLFTVKAGQREDKQTWNKKSNDCETM